ncbi:MAG: hypothetical protein MR835_00190 [Erysipelotrichaceae bacterium]|nr:hypothetical protein [Erysipelotrichaceae bacterium]
MSVDLCLEELFKITKSIDDNYEELICLSKNNKEDSKEYNDTLITLYRNVESSVVFCQNQSIETLQEMIRKINIKMKTNLDGYYYYTAAMNAVSFVYNKKCAQDYSQEEQDEVVSEEIFDEIYQDDEPTEEKYIDNDYPEELDDYYDEAMGMIYLEATRKVITKIKSTYTTNEYEKKYKNRLLKEYNVYYKYDFLSSNIFLELISIKNRFDPFAINIEMAGDFSPLYYNQAIEMITDLYGKNRSNTSPTAVCEDLFSVSVVETIIDLLDVDRLNKLKEFCEEKSSKYNKFNYGNICYVKLKQKLK